MNTTHTTPQQARLTMGNEAAAYGALRAGVNVICGYPGTPSTELLETAASFVREAVQAERIVPADAPHIEWSVNEKAALEIAFGASLCGARALVTMKQVGLNVATDPLLTIATLGVKGGLVLFVADDPGPISSQTEQDTRQFAAFAKVPVLDAASPEELHTMMYEAFALSERHATPVIVRATTRVCHGSAPLLQDVSYEPHSHGAFKKDPKWVIFPPLAYRAHKTMPKRFAQIVEDTSFKAFNVLKEGDSKATSTLGIVAGGISWSYLQDALEQLGLTHSFDLLKIGAPFPFDDTLAAEFLLKHATVMVFEELEPVIERELLRIAGSRHISVDIKGILSGDSALAGESSIQVIAHELCALPQVEAEASLCAEPASIPIANEELLLPRPPVLCAGCPHRASFYAVKKALKGTEATYSGDIGCYTLGNALPLEMTDTCVCMGAGFTVPQGMHWASSEVPHIGFVGDSTFFASGITGVINAVYNQAPVTLVVLDNSITAMTGSQPHPGTGIRMSFDATPADTQNALSIPRILKALGVASVQEINPFELSTASAAVEEAVAETGVNALVFKAPCIKVSKPKAIPSVNEKCTACRVCINSIGCPALTMDTADSKVQIDEDLCYGCDLCTRLCPFAALESNNE